jgi:N-terminal domain of galactosyltransferase
MPSIVIPWRSQPAREPMFAYTTRRLLETHPGWPIHLSDTKAKQFNRAAARNSGVISKVIEQDQIIVILDADTFVEKTALERAVKHVKAYGGVAIPFDTYYAMSYEGTVAFLHGTSWESCAKRHVPRSTGGAIVTTVEAWWACGGMDERFEGWGFEDTAWRIVADMVSPPVIIPGVAVAGGHPTPDRGGIETRRNRGLYYTYKHARKDPAKIQELVSDPARFPITGGRLYGRRARAAADRWG